MHILFVVKRMFKLGIIAQLEHRTSLILEACGTFIFTGFENIAAIVLMLRFGSIQGWKLGEICLLMGTAQITSRIADIFSYGLERVGSKVQEGSFDRYMLRPIPVILQLMFEYLSLRRLGGMLQGIVMYCFAFHFIPEIFNHGTIIFFIYLNICGVFFFLGLFLLKAAMGFWIFEGIEFMNVLIYGGREIIQYPGSIYPKVVQHLLTFIIPYLCVSYYPSSLLLNKVSTNQSKTLFYFSPLLGITFFFIAILFFNFAVTRRQSSGT